MAVPPPPLSTKSARPGVIPHEAARPPLGGPIAGGPDGSVGPGPIRPEGPLTMVSSYDTIGAFLQRRAVIHGRIASLRLIRRYSPFLYGSRMSEGE
jgi:hypothetical protein